MAVSSLHRGLSLRIDTRWRGIARDRNSQWQAFRPDESEQTERQLANE